MNSNMGADKPTILATGLSGLVGSTVASLLSSSFQFTTIGRNTGVAIQHYNQVEQAIGASNAKIILHLAAKTDVDACEKDKDGDMQKLGNSPIEQIDIESLKSVEWQNDVSCFAVNVIGTLNIARACKKYGKKLVYISTDFVFDGTKDGAYTEDDLPHPINFYGQTKYLGEKIVRKLTHDSLIIRLAYPYGQVSHSGKYDFVRRIEEQLSRNEQVRAVTDGLFTPTLMYDIAHALKFLIEKNHVDVLHVVGSRSLSPFDAALLIARHFRHDESLIQPTTMKDFFHNRALRPHNGAMSNHKLSDMGITTNSFDHGLQQIVSL